MIGDILFLHNIGKEKEKKHELYMKKTHLSNLQGLEEPEKANCQLV